MLNRIILVGWLMAVFIFGVFGVPLLFLHWDCDDYTLACYRVGDTLGLDCEIRYQLHDDGDTGHVWVCVEGWNIVGGNRIDGVLTLDELIEQVELDKK